MSGETIGVPMKGRDLPPLRAIALTDDLAWGLTKDGKVVAWGAFAHDEVSRSSPRERKHELREIRSVANATDIVAWAGQVCVRTKGGDISCWDTRYRSAEEALAASTFVLRDEVGAPLPAGELHGLASGDFAIGAGEDRFVVFAGSDRRLLDPRAKARLVRTVAVLRSPPAYAANEIELGSTGDRRPCVLRSGRLSCVAPVPAGSFATVASWGKGDHVDVRSGRVCTKGGTSARCTDRAGVVLEAKGPAEITAVAIKDDVIWFGTVDGRVGVGGADGSTKMLDDPRVDGAITAIHPLSDGSCIATKAGRVWCDTLETPKYVLVATSVLDVAASTTDVVMKLERGGFATLGSKYDAQERLVLFSAPIAKATHLRRRISANGDQPSSIWLDSSGKPWQIDTSDRVEAFELPETLRSQKVAARPDTYADGTQVCMVNSAAEVHCDRPTDDMRLDIAIALRPWTTKVDLPGPARRLWYGDARTCAQLEDGTIHCWGPSNEELLPQASRWSDVTADVEAAR